MKRKKFESANAFTVGIISASSIAIVLLFALIISGKLTGVGGVGEGTVNNPYLFETEIPDDTSDMSVIEFIDTNGEIILTPIDSYAYVRSDVTFLYILCERLEIEGYDITVDSISISAMDGDKRLKTVYPTISSVIGDSLIRADEEGYCTFNVEFESDYLDSPELSVAIMFKWHDADGKVGGLIYQFTDFEDVHYIY